ncbi:dTDP-glucose 4,6-dehydratase [Escherichia phage phiWec190]|nr:dTDP-glucose 4,6-dehydratase [Escherichia phage phiWec188]BDU13663.1 dTDP-glucose 4,6-dehydratase [Escherichia phage phiWec190]
MRYLVTGGLGFIGSAVVRSLCQDPKNEVFVIDKMGYAADIENVGDITHAKLSMTDLVDEAQVKNLVVECNPDFIIHLAAESHVDNSIKNPRAFIDSNIIGTYNLLEAARLLPKNKLKMFVHVSTDEVYGDMEDSGAPFTEETAYAPSSPYSASKAASDHLVKAWHRTYDLPVVITNCSNNFGPYQHPEKLIPKVITNILTDQPIPVYGKGDQVRDWLFVEDHARAIILAATGGEVGQTYNVGTRNPKTNMEIIYMICDYMDAVHPSFGTYPASGLISFVEDRKGHDLHYEINPAKIESELGWKANSTFEEDLYSTIEWYLNNPQWWSMKI